MVRSGMLTHTRTHALACAHILYLSGFNMMEGILTKRPVWTVGLYLMFTLVKL